MKEIPKQEMSVLKYCVITLQIIILVKKIEDYVEKLIQLKGRGKKNERI